MDNETRRKFFIRSMTYLGGIIPFVYGCDSGKGDSGGPLGPSATGVFTSPNPVIVIPQSVTLVKGGTQTFSASGGTGSYSWSESNTSLGAINISTGTFSAGITNGTLNVVATDTAGVGGSGAVTIISATIILAPANITISNSVTVPFTQTYTASGGTSSYFFTFSNNDSASTYIGAALNLTTGVLTVTTIPTAAETDQTYTITATDSSGDTGTTTVILQAV